MRNKIIAFDLDGTLCERPEGIEHLGPRKYDFCSPKQDMIDVLNELYDKEYTIIIYTARGMGQFNGNVKRVYDELYKVTIESLEHWGVKYHQLVMGKIDFDILVDDKAMGIDNLENIKKL